MRRYKVILNPAAGHGNGLKSLPRVKQLLALYGLEHSLVKTEYRGHAIDLTRQAASEGFDVIVAAGGDGTVNEVVNGLMQSKLASERLPALGILGIGRGNDFSGSVGIPQSLEGACQALTEAQRRWVDIGRVTGGIYPQGRYFCNCVGVGFDAITTIEVTKLPRWGGFMSFFVGVLKTVFLYNKAALATIVYGDQSLTQHSLMISIMNGRRLGGGFIMAPDSKPDDGLLDLCIAEQMNPFAVFRMIPHFMRGTQATQQTIKTGRAAKITVTAHDGSLPAQTDGEIICTDGKYLEVDLFPRQLEVIYKP